MGVRARNGNPTIEDVDDDVEVESAPSWADDAEIDSFDQRFTLDTGPGECAA